MASSFGRLQASLAAATNEVTVAAANINFDFTLVKYEAPAEFQPLGQVLAKTRKQEAEFGQTHVTARRLGALFDGLCPETPNLIKAYGKRVSEISKSVTEKEPIEFSKSIFAAFAGVDATSIWAAATSSRAAIHVHLLACMLAEMWDANEAISIWVELIAERRREITSRLEQGEPLHFGLAAAAVQQEVSRENLALWDASARAWIETAKSAMRRKDTQMRLILKNVECTVSASTSVAVSVTEAWKLALTTTENLVSGMPQQVDNGAALLGLTAWHLYPDMHVLGKQVVTVRMSDDLIVDGGELTLGCPPPEHLSSNGVCWSLRLGHLKHYGGPVQRQRSLQDDPCRISFQELLYATVGVILAQWKVTESNIDVPLKTFAKLCDLMSGIGACRSVMSMMGVAAYDCIAGRGDSGRLLRLGQRRPEFLSNHEWENTRALNPFFGLLDPLILLPCINGRDAQEEFLIRVASKVDLSSHTAIIFNAQLGWRVIGDPNNLFGNARKAMEADPVKKRLRSHSAKSTSLAWTLKLSGTRLIVRGPNRVSLTLDLWFGDLFNSAVFVTGPGHVMPPSITISDLLWCFENVSLSEMSLSTRVFCSDPILVGLGSLHRASRIFRALPSLIHVGILSDPLAFQYWASSNFSFKHPREFNSLSNAYFNVPIPDPDTSSILQMAANLIGRFNLSSKDIPATVTGLSIGNSILIPSKVRLSFSLLLYKLC